MSKFIKKSFKRQKKSTKYIILIKNNIKFLQKINFNSSVILNERLLIHN